MRHIERTRALAVLVDTMPPEGDAVQHYESLCREMEHYNEVLLQRPRLVAATKMDLSPPPATVDALRGAAARDGATFCAISSVDGDGLEDFIEWVGAQVPAAEDDEH